MDTPAQRSRLNDRNDALFSIPSQPTTTTPETNPEHIFPNFTFIWDWTHSRVIIPRSLEELLDHPNLRISRTLDIEDIFEKYFPLVPFRGSYNQIIIQEAIIELASSNITRLARRNQLPKPPTLVVDESTKVPKNLECPICVDGVKPNVIFRECCHAFCSSCVVGMVRSVDNGRSTFPCPFCRVSVHEVADMISEGVNHGDSGYHVKYDDATFAQLVWQTAAEWVMVNHDEDLIQRPQFLVITVGDSGILLEELGNREQRTIEVPLLASPLGLSLELWVMICFTKLADIYAGQRAVDADVDADELAL